MKIENWKFGYISEQDIVVFNDGTYSFRVCDSHILTDVTLSFSDSGSLRVTGKKIIYDCYLYETPEDEWENEPEEDAIQVKRIGIFKKHTIRYLKGWVRTKKRIPFDVEFGNGWTLERRQ